MAEHQSMYICISAVKTIRAAASPKVKTSQSQALVFLSIDPLPQIETWMAPPVLISQFFRQHLGNLDGLCSVEIILVAQEPDILPADDDATIYSIHEHLSQVCFLP